MYNPTCVFCGHPTLLYNITANLYMCKACERKHDLGIQMERDLFYNPPKKPITKE